MLGCGGIDSGPPDASRDAGDGADLSTRDAGTDAAVDISDTGAPDVGPDVSSRRDGGSEPLPYASELASSDFGPGAGYGRDELPDIVLGPPNAVSGGGSLAVLSLGMGGTITLGFGDRVIYDGPGDDFIVYENPFYIGGDPTMVFAELAEVSVSADGQTWHTFDCDTTASTPGQWPGCAGWTPTMDFAPEAVVPLDPAVTGGDAFDLADLGLEEARFIRIRDLGDDDTAPTAGFDLDAVGGVYLRDDDGA
jgi:hypothetical protein